MKATVKTDDGALASPLSNRHTPTLVRVVGVLLVLIASPLFLVLAIWRRVKTPAPRPIEYVLLPPLSRRDES
jgi:hypothetical protein